MRISVRESDRAYSPDIGPKCIIYLNGEMVEDCITADEELRFVEIIKRRDGKLSICGGRVMTEKLYGKVQIELPDDGRPRFQRVP